MTTKDTSRAETGERETQIVERSNAIRGGDGRRPRGGSGARPGMGREQRRQRRAPAGEHGAPRPDAADRRRRHAVPDPPRPHHGIARLRLRSRLVGGRRADRRQTAPALLCAARPQAGGWQRARHRQGDPCQGAPQQGGHADGLRQHRHGGCGGKGGRGRLSLEAGRRQFDRGRSARRRRSAAAARAAHVGRPCPLGAYPAGLRTVRAKTCPRPRGVSTCTAARCSGSSPNGRRWKRRPERRRRKRKVRGHGRGPSLPLRCAGVQRPGSIRRW